MPIAMALLLLLGGAACTQSNAHSIRGLLYDFQCYEGIGTPTAEECAHGTPEHVSIPRAPLGDVTFLVDERLIAHRMPEVHPSCVLKGRSLSNGPDCPLRAPFLFLLANTHLSEDNYPDAFRRILRVDPWSITLTRGYSFPVRFLRPELRRGSYYYFVPDDGPQDLSVSFIVDRERRPLALTCAVAEGARDPQAMIDACLELASGR